MKDEEEGLAKVQQDLCKPCTKDGTAIPVPVSVSKVTGAMCGTYSRKKGGDDEYQVAAHTKWSENIGHTDIILEIDGEPSAIAFAKKIQERRNKSTQIKPMPKGSKGGLGAVDVAHYMLESKMRSYFSDFKEKTGMDMAENERLVIWLVRHIPWSHTRFQKRSDGHTAYYHMRGKDYKGFIEAFASVVMIKLPDVTKTKAEPRWVKAVWVGKEEETDNHIGLTPEGVVKGRTAKPLDAEASWDVEFIKSVREFPWNRTEDQQKRHCRQSPFWRLEQCVVFISHSA